MYPRPQPQPKASEPSEGLLAPFGSEPHMAWIRQRLSKNISFRRQVEASSRRALTEYHARRVGRLAS